MNQIYEQLVQLEAIKTGHFTLKSGLTSSYYIDLRCAVSSPSLLQTISSELWKKISNLPCELLCGVPYTAIPFATTVSFFSNKPLILRRKEPKKHGNCSSISGCYQEGNRCIVIEDVVTTGSSILETVSDLRSTGLVVENVVAIVDRNQGGEENLQKEGIQLHHLFHF